MKEMIEAHRVANEEDAQEDERERMGEEDLRLHSQ